RLLAAEREQLPGQRAARDCGLADLCDSRPVRDLGWQVFEQQVAVTQDHREQVIEVVRYAASQASHGLHLLGLEQLSLETPLLRDVAHEGLIVLHAARPVAHGADTDLAGSPATV